MTVAITDASRALIEAAGARAQDHGDSQIREEHLLAAVAADPAGLAVLRRLNNEFDSGAVLDDVRRARRRGGLTTAEVDAVAELRIDVNAVVDRVEAALGAGAVDTTVGRRRSSWRGPSVSAGLNAVLVCAHRQVLARNGRELRVEHLVLGLIACGGVVADALVRHGITLTAALAALDGDDPQPGVR